MNYTNTANISTVTAGDESGVLLSENGRRIGFYISVTGAPVWVKLQAASSDDDRKGMLISDAAPFPFSFMPDNIYYGEISVINVIPATAPVVHVTEVTL